jgi:hypothetical protein
MKRLPPSLCVVLAFWLGLALDASAQWSIASQSPVENLGHGAWFVRKEAAGPTEAELQLVFFDAARCSLRVIDQPTRANAGSLKDAMRGSGAIAGCNGAYFNSNKESCQRIPEICRHTWMEKLVRQPRNDNG